MRRVHHGCVHDVCQALRDDSLTKPFARSHRSEAVRGGDALRLDPVTHAMHAGERESPLTPTEFRLLAALAARPGKVVRRRNLISAGWPDGAIVHDNTLDAYVARSRRKLRALDVPDEIATVRGVGDSLR